jgi:predicted 3-demethylubiquinone-9 3-methyltransferase (glyoxalase superfamily)
MPQTIIPNLWFDTQAEEAAQLYCSVFERSRIVGTTHYPEGGPGPAGTVMTVEWELDGQRFVGINGGPQFTFTEAVSLQISCETQEEVDHYWERLTDGGEEGPCGWLKDRYGLSWQVVPTVLDEAVRDDDPARAQRAMSAMMGMRSSTWRRCAGPRTGRRRLRTREAPGTGPDDRTDEAGDGSSCLGTVVRRDLRQERAGARTPAA